MRALPVDLAGLSARERNKLKRKSRALQRCGSQEGSSKRSKSGSDAIDSAAEQAEAEADSQDWQDICAGQWPFQAVCDQMCVDVLDPAWEVRWDLLNVIHQISKSYRDNVPVVDQSECDLHGMLSYDLHQLQSVWATFGVPDWWRHEQPQQEAAKQIAHLQEST